MILMERPRYTLLELSNQIGKTIEKSFPGNYWLVSEINEIRENINGHCYLELVEKDSENDRIIARARATIWSNTWRMLKSYFETSTSQSLARGMMVLVEVSVIFHELYGLSFNIRDIDPVYTLGDLELKRAETIRRLQREGIFDMNRELPFPVLPSRVAVISSPRAAGYEDFLHQITTNPKKYRFEITLFPAIMQGDNTVSSVTCALEEIFSLENEFDIVVILRGGGAASDLNSFDSYEIASHIAQMPLPVITGIGHERDRNIAGMVAHTDLKTPTAVAEFLVGKFSDLDSEIRGLSSKLAGEVSRVLSDHRQFIKTTVREMPMVTGNNISRKRRHLTTTGTLTGSSATRYMQKNRHRLDSYHTGFGFVIKNYLLTGKNKALDSGRKIPEKIREMIRKKSGRLEMLDKTLMLVDPVNVLKKGYAMVYRGGRLIKSITEIHTGDLLVTGLQDGKFSSRVTGKENPKAD
jgi:exodeoxyribonuclease VII large subunit